MITAERKIAAVAFLTFVALDEHKKPIKVANITPQTHEEKLLYTHGEDRANMRKNRRQQSKHLIQSLNTVKPWALEVANK
ncbi:putative acyl-CoA hydrolase [Staphylococcus aureus]|nr:putative acyl-CoA hydrolase [Staphylococcus aureus]